MIDGDLLAIIKRKLKYNTADKPILIVANYRQEISRKGN